MKKIHITEEQLRYCVKKLYEASNDEITIDAKPDANGTVSVGGLKQQYTDAKSKVGSSTQVNMNISGADLAEGKTYTKKQIEDAKLNAKKANCKVYKKKDIK